MNEKIILAILHKLENIDSKQNIIIEQLSALSKAYAKEYDLAIEDGELECEYINDCR